MALPKRYADAIWAAKHFDLRAAQMRTDFLLGNSPDLAMPAGPDRR
jgi:hypothetical protein